MPSDSQTKPSIPRSARPRLRLSTLLLALSLFAPSSFARDPLTAAELAARLAKLNELRELCLNPKTPESTVIAALPKLATAFRSAYRYESMAEDLASRQSARPNSWAIALAIARLWESQPRRVLRSRAHSRAWSLIQ